jgi:hypothetical protein
VSEEKCDGDAGGDNGDQSENELKALMAETALITEVLLKSGNNSPAAWKLHGKYIECSWKLWQVWAEAPAAGCVFQPIRPRRTGEKSSIRLCLRYPDWKREVEDLAGQSVVPPF